MKAVTDGSRTAHRLLKKVALSPAQPWRAKTRLVPGKAAAPELTFVLRFTPHISRLLGVNRERSWGPFSAAC